MLAGAIVLIVLGVLIGIVFPVVFPVTAVGIAVLVVWFVGAKRRAKTGAVGTDEPGTPTE